MKSLEREITLIKPCSGCKRNLFAGAFHKNRARYDGLSVYCKDCRRSKDPNKSNGSANHKAWFRTPRGRFHVQRMNACRRGIPFLLTFEEWLAVWGDLLGARGRSGYVMARHGDAGPYAVGNVRIITTQENSREQRR
jgi:hypothetical protein